MECGSSLASLLENLRISDPWTSPGTWEAIPSESGVQRPADQLKDSRDRTDEPSCISDNALVHLALHVLYGIKSSLAEVGKIYSSFCSTPADRTMFHVSNLWCRSSSTAALGEILKSFACTGLEVFFLRKFVLFFLYDRKEVAVETKMRIGRNEVGHCCDMVAQSPYSLVTQAFAVAVETVLDGYFCALSTLSSSIKLRRSKKDHSSAIDYRSSGNSEVTLLEVYLHTEELRRHIMSLANICFPKYAGLDLSKEDLTTNTNFQFQNFPMGADLLSYLYNHLRNADVVHYDLLKYLFVSSCEPYFNFIKSWIYQARISDPYGEFLVENAGIVEHNVRNPNDEVSPTSIQHRNNISLPCFLKSISHYILRTGQQLQILIRLLDVCNREANKLQASVFRNLDEILPYWFTRSSCSSFPMTSLTFSGTILEEQLHEREIMYKMMSEKLHCLLSELEVVNLDNISSSLNNQSANIEDPLFSSGVLTFSASSEEGEAAMMSDWGSKNLHTSDDFSWDEDPIQSSESSSCDSLEELESEEGASDKNSFNSILDHRSTIVLNNLLGTVKSFSGPTVTSQIHSDDCRRKNYEHYEQNFTSEISALQTGNAESDAKPDISNTDCTLGLCLSIRKLETSFANNMERSDLSKIQLNDCSESVHGITGEQETNQPLFAKEFDPQFSSMEPSQDFSFGLESLSTNQSGNIIHTYNLWVNPQLTQVSLHKGVSLHDIMKMRKHELPFYDFTSVATPLESYDGMVSTSSVDGLSKTWELASAVSNASKPMEQSSDVKKAVRRQTIIEMNLPPGKEIDIRENLQPSGTGGAMWNGKLGYFGKFAVNAAGDNQRVSSTLCELPLDVVIEKCIVQEVLLQYKFVSNFTLQLLEEGFDMNNHLMAFRRYHFMELADWVDPFITSLCSKNLSIGQPERRQAEVQALLNQALQTSSCYSDPYRHRLFVYMREQSSSHLSSFIESGHVYDDILLGYRVDWPINIIVTKEALRMYADVFCYLVQVRAAALSLIKSWCYIKELTRTPFCSKKNGADKLKECHTIIRLRSKLHHFVSTLEQYIHCSLSNITWGGIQNSRNYKVRDMLDLEPLHLSFLSDALRICFLSVEAKPILELIKRILQCASELHSCFENPKFRLEEDRQSFPDFSQIHVVNHRFESSIKDLHILYLKSKRHRNQGLTRFWEHLNYNEFYSSSVSNEFDLAYR